MLESQNLLLGIDGGGTKTVALLARAADPDQILATAYAGPSNQRAVGPVLAMQNLDLAVHSAFELAAIPRCTVAAACLGLAGADRDSDRGVILRWAEEARLAHKVRVVNDAVPLLSAGSGTGTGVALIAGTGSLAWGCNSSGESARAGGWGWLMGDEGSAWSIGSAVLKAVVFAADGRGPQTPLSPAVCEQLQISTAPELVARIYSAEIPRALIAELAPLAFTHAHNDDPVASRIVSTAGQDLALMVRTVADRLQLPQKLPLAATGAVLTQQPALLQAVVTHLGSDQRYTPVVSVVHNAATGALRLAAGLLQST
jgi:N-acetylglucosamine kinase-like BadF-type ATPase